MIMEQLIERVPGVMGGKLVFAGTRITVEFIMERLAQGATHEELLQSYPALTPGHLQAAMAFALSLIRYEALIDAA